MENFRFGIDLGGTKIEILALDRGGSERLRTRVATPAGDYAATLATIAGLVFDAEQKLAASGSVGIATPGALSRVSGRIKNANSTCLNGQALQKDIEEYLQRPVRIENDANCFALSETLDGAALSARIAFGVILGTGVGGGIAVDKQVLTGANAIAGEWGHNPLPLTGADEIAHAPQCYCGRRGCIETWLSGPAMSADHARNGGEHIEPAQIVARAARGDTASEATLQRYEDRLARALAGVVNILDPDVIVLGGGLSNIARWYEDVPARWGRYIFSDHVATRLVPPRFGDSSGARGAAWLWNE